jgi:hypothetical protein
MQQAQLVNDIRNSTSAFLSQVEQAQARAAAVVQEYDALGGVAFLAGFDWETTDVTETQITTAIYSLRQMANIISDHQGNLYIIKS